MREAQDFLPGGSRLEADLDLRAIIAGHRTPALKGASVQSLTPQAAMQAYFTFAQEQLGLAAGEELAASIAYHGLGKLHAAIAERERETIRAPAPKAMSFYQAALLVNRLNYMASNDLGVLLARSNRYEDARTAVEHSLSIQPNSVGWQNLSVIYQRFSRLQRALGHMEAAAKLDLRRRELWQHWDHRLPHNGFVQRQLAARPATPAVTAAL